MTGYHLPTQKMPELSATLQYVRMLFYQISSDGLCSLPMTKPFWKMSVKIYMCTLDCQHLHHLRAGDSTHPHQVGGLRKGYWDSQRSNQSTVALRLCSFTHPTCSQHASHHRCEASWTTTRRETLVAILTLIGVVLIPSKSETMLYSSKELQVILLLVFDQHVDGLPS